MTRKEQQVQYMRAYMRAYRERLKSDPVKWAEVLSREAKIRRERRKANPMIAEREARIARESRKRTPPKPRVRDWRAHNLAAYGLTKQDHAALVAAQGGRCAICYEEVPVGGKTGLAVDHDHTTGKVRGLLCPKCNMALGLMKDSPTLLASAIQYLLTPREAHVSP